MSRPIFLILFFIIASFLAQAQFANFSFWGVQPVIWTWMKGTAVFNNPGEVAGTQGVPAAANTPGGRSTMCSAIDASGNFWMFGGHDRTGGAYTKNDLWKYRPSNNDWTWIWGVPGGAGETPVFGTKGVPSTANGPGGLVESSCWFDDNGYFWIFGGFESGSLNYNTLWRFNPSNLEWTWMHGSSTTNDAGVYGTKGTPTATTTPSAREKSGGWKGAGNTYYIYGGWDNGAGGRKSDMWKYDHASNQWTWVAGPSTINEAPVFGTLGVELGTNTPGNRRLFQSYVDVDSNGKFWLFGGDGSGGTYADMWRFDPGTNNWTWMAGSSTVNEAGSWNSKYFPNAANKPANKRVHSFFIINGLFHVFGGYNSLGDWNDFWTYSFVTSLWTWRGGSNTVSAVPVTGTILVPSASNDPGARDGFIVWKDNSGRIWIFGGETGASGKSSNDVWVGVVK